MRQSLEMQQQAQASDEDADGFVNYPLTVGEVEAVAMLKECEPGSLSHESAIERRRQRRQSRGEVRRRRSSQRSRLHAPRQLGRSGEHDRRSVARRREACEWSARHHRRRLKESVFSNLGQLARNLSIPKEKKVQMAPRGLSGEDARPVDGPYRQRQRQDDVRAGFDDACRRTRLEVLHDSVHEVAQRSLRRTRFR